MGQAISRKGLLQGDFTGKHRPLRPPWALPEDDFIDSCTGCGECIEACPEHILVRGRGNYPRIDFRKGSCTFCGACRNRCSSGSLLEGVAPWTLKAHIEAHCLALAEKVVCRSCGEQCEARAIRFRPTLGGVPRPEIDPRACTGCGACYSPCPVTAINISPPAEGKDGS